MASSNVSLSAEEETIPIVNFTAAAEARFTPEQVIIKPSNYVALTDIPAERAHLKDGAEFIKKCPLHFAFSHTPVGITAHLQQFWYTAHCTQVTTDNGKKLSAIEFTTALGTIAITVGVIRNALKLPARAKTERWEAPPTTEDIIDFLDSTGYFWPMDAENQRIVRTTTKVEKRRMPARWQYIWTHVIQCLGTKVGSQDQASKSIQEIAVSLCTGRKLNYAEYIFAELFNRTKSQKRDKAVPFPRFVATVLAFVYSDYPSEGNQTFSQIGKKALESDDRVRDSPYTRYMLTIARDGAAQEEPSSLRSPSANIPGSPPPPPILKRKAPADGHKKTIAHKPATKRTRTVAPPQSPVIDLGSQPPSPSSFSPPATTTASSPVAASSALPPSQWPRSLNKA